MAPGVPTHALGDLVRHSSGSRTVIVTRARLTREIASKDAIIADLTAQVADWKGKAERLIDANLARAGAIHEPTMVNRKVSDRGAGAAGMMAAALAITEIDSSLSRKKAV
jgi:hypothetical protein